MIPSVPAKREGKILRLLNKAKLACLSIAGPDFVWCAAVGQFWSAYASVQVRSFERRAGYCHR